MELADQEYHSITITGTTDGYVQNDYYMTCSYVIAQQI